MIEPIAQLEQQPRDTYESFVLGTAFAQDLRQHVEDSIRSKEFEYASCMGCGLRVKQEGYCHKCA